MRQPSLAVREAFAAQYGTKPGERRKSVDAVATVLRLRRLDDPPGMDTLALTIGPQRPNDAAARRNDLPRNSSLRCSTTWRTPASSASGSRNPDAFSPPHRSSVNWAYELTEGARADLKKLATSEGECPCGGLFPLACPAGLIAICPTRFFVFTFSSRFPQLIDFKPVLI